MHRTAWLATLAFGLAGCGPSVQHQVRLYNEDGVYLFQRGEYLGARHSFEAALALQPGNTGLLYNIGECYERLGNVKKAEEVYQQCLQKEPNHARCRHSLTVLLVNTGRRKDALLQTEEWMAREPNLPDPYAEDGWLWHQSGDLTLAQARLQQALDKDPHNLRALTELAMVYEELGLPERARVLYERALEIDPRQPAVVEQLNRLRAKGVSRPKP
jgi:Tfp pilus assembly protein PilF